MNFFPHNHAGDVIGVVGLTATGTDQSTAFLIYEQQTAFSSVPPGSGAVLPYPGGMITVYNEGANVLLLYPGPGDQILGNAIDMPVTVSPGMAATFVSFDNNLTAPPRIWRQFSDSGGGAGGGSIREPTIMWESSTLIYSGIFTYTQYAAQAGTIDALEATVGTAGGSVTTTVKINGVPVTGINAVTVNSGATQSFTATATNTFVAGAVITLTLLVSGGAPAGSVFTLLVTE